MRTDPRVQADSPGVVVRVAGPEDWELLRELRQRVLSTDPDAFGSTLELEQGLDEPAWRARLEHGHSVFASVGEEYVGLGGSFEDGPGSRMVVSMWVAPEMRGRGIGRAILDAVLAEATESTIRLWVADGNSAARRLYERAGFVDTGVREPLRAGAELMKSQLELVR
jgi:ribosomal protein S18 acetylase RimI-like enzyme